MSLALGFPSRQVSLGSETDPYLPERVLHSIRQHSLSSSFKPRGHTHRSRDSWPGFGSYSHEAIKQPCG